MAEIALVAIAAVWGLTFVMVQDAVAILPVMAFLAYRFIPASVIVALVFLRQLPKLSRDGLAAGLVMGVLRGAAGITLLVRTGDTASI